MGRFGSPRHLVGRFVDMLDPSAPPAAETAWACAHLGPNEQALWARMSGPDRRHAVVVARRAVSILTEPTAARAGPGSARAGPGSAGPGGSLAGGGGGDAVVAAALLHDVGKVEAGLGPVGRAAATVAGVVAPRQAAAGEGRVARYLTHDRRGAALLEAAGSDPLVVAWAREHHLPPARWTVPAAVGSALKAADDD